MNQALYLQPEILVKQSKMFTMPLSLSSFPAKFMKGKKSSGQSVLFACAGDHGLVRTFNGRVLVRLGRSSE